GSQSFSSRVVFIIDKVQHLETLEALSESHLFSNHRIMAIAIARKEHFDKWNNSGVRLSRLGFNKWFVPCLWDIDLDKALFSASFSVRADIETAYQAFIKHLGYKGRGSLGNIIRELRDPKNTSYGPDFNFIDVASIVNRADVRHNAW